VIASGGRAATVPGILPWWTWQPEDLPVQGDFPGPLRSGPPHPTKYPDDG